LEKEAFFSPFSFLYEWSIKGYSFLEGIGSMNTNGHSSMFKVQSEVDKE